MKNVVCVWKPVGLTPLEMVNRFKEKNLEYKNETISYAGRLDPMAEGVLVLLVGNENKNRDKYLGLDKEYITEIIFGVSTDTYDSLGLITKTNFEEISKKEIEKIIDKFKGKQKQIYPPFSSKVVNGKPLYWWAREKRLDEIKIPDREINIYSIELLDYEKVLVEDMVKKLINEIKKVEGDFRQDEIVSKWEKFGKENKDTILIKVKIRINCSSGTYIRRFAEDLGRRLDTVAFAKSITRAKVGEMIDKKCIII